MARWHSTGRLLFLEQHKRVYYWLIPCFFLTTVFFVTGCNLLFQTSAEQSSPAMPEARSALNKLALPTNRPLATITPLPPTETPSPTATPKPSVVVIDDLVNIRDNPNTEAAILGSVVKGITLELLGQNDAGDWSHVCCIHEQAGWVYSELVQHKAQMESVATAQAVKNKLEAPSIVGWQTFAAPELGFTVVLPGMPNKQVSALHTLAGTLPYSVFTTGFEGAVYTLGFADLSRPSFEPSQIFASVRDDMLATLQGSLIDENALDDQGFPGREFNLVPPNARNNVLVRLYLSNTRLYVLTVTTTKELVRSDNVMHFLNSFQLLQE